MKILIYQNKQLKIKKFSEIEFSEEIPEKRNKLNIYILMLMKIMYLCKMEKIR
jgi:hypothetical protein